MKLLIIGHSVVDNINNIIKPGGIYYSLLGFDNYKNEYDEIYLLTSVSKDTYNYFEDLYSRINNKYFQKVNSIPTVYLKLFENKEREECYTNISDNLNINHEMDFSKFDGIFINMITGFDISLRDLKYIRSKYSGPIYFDVHTLSRGIDENNKRIFRKIPNSSEWLMNIDILQANEHELFTLTDQNNIDHAASNILGMGIKILIITKGTKGASIYYNENSIIRMVEIDGLKLDSINSVGCGDIFGAVFFYSYIKSGILYESLKIANSAAGVSTTYNSFNNYKYLKEDADRLIN